MKEQSIINPFVELSKDQLIGRLVANEYPFAIWRSPKTNSFNFIISLEEAKQQKISIEELSKGFCINRYKDNHPSKPYFITADIHIQDDETIIDPRINDQKIESFFSRMSMEQTDFIKIIQPKAEFQSIDASSFESKVELAIDEIRKGSLEKIVLSRFLDVALSKDFSSWNFFKNISKAYPNAFCSISFIPGKGLWMGATPELLISDNDKGFKTIALAGTKKLDEAKQLKEVAWTHKEIQEQAFVSRYIINCFKKLRLREFHEHGPKTIRSGTLTHLKTEFEVKYEELPFDQLASQMLELLHPTSAVCGMPIQVAKDWIDQVESYDRSFYAGFLGPVNFDGSTELYVNLRCIKIENGRARLYAGAGITEDSIPSKELEETQFKMEVMKRFL